MSRRAFSPVSRFEVLPSDVRAVRDQSRRVWPVHLRDSCRGAIKWFSPASMARLTRRARNAFPALRTQFCLTYHESNPDGETAKTHLHAWLAALRRYMPEVKYLWILEFQTRGVPHFHVWLNCEWSRELWQHMGAAWSRIAEPNSEHHLWWHTKARSSRRGRRGAEMSCIPWDMGRANYLRKYMSKKAQKCVPDGFGWVGRFWGSSRGLVPEPVVFEAGDMTRRELIDITRHLSRWAEARARRVALLRRCVVRSRRARADRYSVWVNCGSSVFFELVRRLDMSRSSGQRRGFS